MRSIGAKRIQSAGDIAHVIGYRLAVADELDIGKAWRAPDDHATLAIAIETDIVRVHQLRLTRAADTTGASWIIDELLRIEALHLIAEIGVRAIEVRAAQNQVPAAIVEIGAEGDFHLAGGVSALPIVAVLEVHLQAFELLIEDQVHDACYRIGPPGCRGAAGDDVHALDQARGQRREIDASSDVG